MAAFVLSLESEFIIKTNFWHLKLKELCQKSSISKTYNLLQCNIYLNYDGLNKLLLNYF